MTPRTKVPSPTRLSRLYPLKDAIFGRGSSLTNGSKLTPFCCRHRNSSETCLLSWGPYLPSLWSQDMSSGGGYDATFRFPARAESTFSSNTSGGQQCCRRPKMNNQSTLFWESSPPVYLNHVWKYFWGTCFSSPVWFAAPQGDVTGEPVPPIFCTESSAFSLMVSFFVLWIVWRIREGAKKAPRKLWQCNWIKLSWGCCFCCWSEVL